MPLRTPNEMGIIDIGRHHYQNNYFKKETEYLAVDGNGEYVGNPQFNWGWGFVFTVLLKIGMKKSLGAFFLACTFKILQRTSEGWKNIALKVDYYLILPWIEKKKRILCKTFLDSYPSHWVQKNSLLHSQDQLIREENPPLSQTKSS